jgi:16S rRNA (cytidine1402-2'-O)-methyltransferase
VGFGTLFLVPSTLGGGSAYAVVPQAVQERVRGLDHFVAEDPKTARAFLKLIGMPRPMAQIGIERLDHNTPQARIDELLAPALRGMDLGVISEAGCPAIADPGALLVRRAHQRGIRVAPLVGPSSILLALMASGLESQRFAFHGYLPVKPEARALEIRRIESRSLANRETQIFIETPYRNEKLYGSLLRACRPDTLLCIATDLTLDTESVHMLQIAQWKKQKSDISDRPSVFLLLARP